jgi:uncharacterized protein (DUF2062 family)
MKASLRRALEALLGIDDTPRRVALAFAVGLYIAFFPIIGIHTLMALGVGFAFRLSRAALLIGAYVNNPWTIVPLYTAGTVLGCWLLGMPTADVFRDGLPVHKGARVLAQTLRPLLWPYVVGNTVAGLVAGAVGYEVVRRVLERRRRVTESGLQAAETGGTAV